MKGCTEGKGGGEGIKFIRDFEVKEVGGGKGGW